MKKNLGGVFKNLFGQPLVQNVPDPNGAVQKDANGDSTLDASGNPMPVILQRQCLVSEMVATALLFDHPSESLNASEKHLRFKLAQRINSAYTHVFAEGSEPVLVDLSTEECTLIKTLMAKLYSALIVGQLVDIIES